VTGATALVALHDLDLLADEAADATSALHLKGLGLAALEPARVARARARAEADVDRRAIVPYERARGRYGRGLVLLRDRVCLGCFVTLPRSGLPEPGGVGICESCSRLQWRR
jgi:predicted  nucleic acid-binding Zn-ribbon protein